MALRLRGLQQWNQWIAQHFLGCHLLSLQQQILSSTLNKYFGKHALLIGVPHQYPLMSATKIPYHTLLTPLPHRDRRILTIESNLYELPLLTGSIDLVMLPHTLEFVDHPRQLLAEACRIIKPEGLMVICGFNPYSAWGVRKALSRQQQFPWAGNFIYPSQVKAWLSLADFALEGQTSLLFRPPFTTRLLYDKLEFLESIGKALLPFAGSVYLLTARAKVIPLTPIKMQWKQQLSGMRISTGL